MNSEDVKYIETELEEFKKQCREYDRDSEDTIRWMVSAMSRDQGNGALMSIARNYQYGSHVPMDKEKAISIYRYILENRSSFPKVKFRELYGYLSSVSLETGDMEDYIRYKALSGRITTDEDLSILMDSLDFDNFDDLVEVTAKIYYRADRYHGNKFIKELLSHSELYQGREKSALFIERMRLSYANFISDENLDSLYGIVMGLVKDYSDIDDKGGDLAYEMFRIILAHDGINKARLWLQTAAMKGCFAAIHEFVEAGNYPSISAWKDSVEGIVANDGLRSKVHYTIFGSFQPIPVPKDLDEDVMKWDHDSVVYRMAEAVRCYNDGDYAGFAANYLKSRGTSREMDYYSLAIIHKGLGMEKDTDLARNIPIKDGYLDSEIIRKKLAEGFNLTPWGEPLTD